MTSVHRVLFLIRPPLKKMLFPVQWPGEDVIAECFFFFFFLSFCHFFFFFCQKFQNFLTGKEKKESEKKEKIVGRPTGHNFGHPLDRKQIFLRVALLSRQAKAASSRH